MLRTTTPGGRVATHMVGIYVLSLALFVQTGAFCQSATYVLMTGAVDDFGNGPYPQTMGTIDGTFAVASLYGLPDIEITCEGRAYALDDAISPDASFQYVSLVGNDNGLTSLEFSTAVIESEDVAINVTRMAISVTTSGIDPCIRITGSGVLSLSQVTLSNAASSSASVAYIDSTANVIMTDVSLGCTSVPVFVRSTATLELDSATIDLAVCDDATAATLFDGLIILVTNVEFNGNENGIIHVFSATNHISLAHRYATVLPIDLIGLYRLDGLVLTMFGCMRDSNSLAPFARSRCVARSTQLWALLLTLSERCSWRISLSRMV